MQSVEYGTARQELPWQSGTPFDSIGIRGESKEAEYQVKCQRGEETKGKCCGINKNAF
jgi:hypothetical protein